MGPRIVHGGGARARPLDAEDLFVGFECAPLPIRELPHDLCDQHLVHRPLGFGRVNLLNVVEGR